MFEVPILQVCLCTDFTQRLIIVIHSAVKTVCVFNSLQQVPFNTFRAGIFFAILAYDFFAKNGGVIVQTNGTGLGFYNGFLGFLRRHNDSRLL
jgi:hypothetical protein